MGCAVSYFVHDFVHEPSEPGGRPRPRPLLTCCVLRPDSTGSGLGRGNGRRDGANCADSSLFVSHGSYTASPRSMLSALTNCE